MAAGSLALTGVLAGSALCLTSGCSSLAYIGQTVGGHLDIVQRTRPVPDWLADPATPEPLRQRLVLSQRIRDFAVSALQLPDNRSYRAYADLQRDAVVWNVVAAPELSLTLKTWCFPVMGCVGYRGYFSRAPAESLASELRGEGWEADVYGVPAYSTLGWTNWLGGDPLLNTFIQWSEGELARLIFHELAHQVAYAADDTAFNESFAVAVERLGSARWLAQQAGPAARDEHARVEQRRQDFRALTAQTRGALLAVYSGTGDEPAKRQAKAAALARFRSDYAALKRDRWGGYAGYDGWVARANNASFGVQAAYDDLVADFERLFARSGSDFDRFYAAARTLAGLPRDERRAKLQAP